MFSPKQGEDAAVLGRTPWSISNGGKDIHNGFSHTYW